MNSLHLTQRGEEYTYFWLYFIPIKIFGLNSLKCASGRPLSETILQLDTGFPFSARQKNAYAYAKCFQAGYLQICGLK